MKPFPGFPAKLRFSAIPNLFFSDLLPQINDLVELKVTLYILQTLYQKRGYPRFVTFKELTGSQSLLSGLGGEPEALRRALEQATQRGSLLHVTLEGEGGPEDLYLLNTEADRRAKAQLESGELPLGQALSKGEPEATPPQQPNIFALYEANIGLLTPMIAEELKEAEKLYPPSWIEEAFREAVSLNKRSWRYILRILERWAQEGRGDGEPGRDSKAAKYFKGKYGHLVQR